MKKQNSIRIHKRMGLFYLIFLISIGISIQGCATGYVPKEPEPIEYQRPSRPGDRYVWINGDWIWDRWHGVYVYRPGYWGYARPNRVYVPGYWYSTPRGNAWRNGRWVPEGREKSSTDDRRR
jgi:hypothetical protein